MIAIQYPIGFNEKQIYIIIPLFTISIKLKNNNTSRPNNMPLGTFCANSGGTSNLKGLY